MNLLVFANSYFLISGGDVITGNIASRLLSFGNRVRVVTNERGKTFFNNCGISSKDILLWKLWMGNELGVVIGVITQTIFSCVRGLLTNHKPDIIWSCSIYPCDLFPAVIQKIRNPKAVLIVGWYLVLNYPSEVYYYNSKVFLWANYLVQEVSSKLIKKYCGLVITSSEYEGKKIAHLIEFNPDRILPIRGGVNISRSKRKAGIKKYDAIYVGRFHPQKNLDELVEVWRHVVKHKPNIKLVLVGDGTEYHAIRALIDKKALGNNISMLGVKIGREKLALLRQSKVFISASTHDTGNIALDEALSLGLPGVIYESPHLDYPVGVIRVKSGRKKRMALEIISLLENKQKYISLSRAALEFAKGFSWRKKTSIFINHLDPLLLRSGAASIMRPVL